MPIEQILESLLNRYESKWTNQQTNRNMPLAETLEKLRTGLLDTSGNNALVKLPIGKARARIIKAVSSNIVDYVNTLIDDEEDISIIPKPAQAGLFPEPPPEHYTVLQSESFERELNSRLKGLLDKARLDLEEKGFNSLFIALGIVSYPFDGEIFQAPLLLIPIKILYSPPPAWNINRWKVEWTNNKVEFNICLQKKLNGPALNINLPEYIAEEDSAQAMQNYFSQVREYIQTLDADLLKLDLETIYIGSFQYDKLQMYKDINPANWNGELAAQGSLISRMLSEYAPQQSQDDIDISSGKLDKIDTVNSLKLVVEADSSQTIAIHDAIQGKDLVIQGPPGTGKSQTITNILIGAAAAGKRVLFIADKKAALDVVYSRIADVGLKGVYLELHSKKTSRKEFFSTYQTLRDAVIPDPPAVVLPNASKTLLQAYHQTNLSTLCNNRTKIYNQAKFAHYLNVENRIELNLPSDFKNVFDDTNTNQVRTLIVNLKEEKAEYLDILVLQNWLHFKQIPTTSEELTNSAIYLLTLLEDTQQTATKIQAIAMGHDCPTAQMCHEVSLGIAAFRRFIAAPWINDPKLAIAKLPELKSLGIECAQVEYSISKLQLFFNQSIFNKDVSLKINELFIEISKPARFNVRYIWLRFKFSKYLSKQGGSLNKDALLIVLVDVLKVNKRAAMAQIKADELKGAYRLPDDFQSSEIEKITRCTIENKVREYGQKYIKEVV